MKDTYLNAKLVQPDLLRLIVFSSLPWEKIEPVLVTDLERLEFAAAAVAVYDNTMMKLINDKTLCTADGRQTLSFKDSDAYKYALKLREHAIACVSDIWVDDSFSFAAAEG